MEGEQNFPKVWEIAQKCPKLPHRENFTWPGYLAIIGHNVRAVTLRLQCGTWRLGVRSFNFESVGRLRSLPVGEQNGGRRGMPEGVQSLGFGEADHFHLDVGQSGVEEA